jgi:hypothetical protein
MAVLRYSGVLLEADVETAAENFSGDETRSATNETNDQANIESRDSI